MGRIAALIGWLLAGGALGLLSVLSLRWTVDRLRPEAPLPGIGLAAAGMLARWGAAAGLLLVALRQGGLAGGIAALAGSLAARWIMIWRLNRAAGRSGGGDRGARGALGHDLAPEPSSRPAACCGGPAPGRSGGEKRGALDHDLAPEPSSRPGVESTSATTRLETGGSHPEPVEG